MMKQISVKDFLIGNNSPLTIISGPCVIESEEHTFKCVEQLQEVFSNFPIQWIFKASYDKANRSSISSFRGPGIKKGLEILKKVRKEFNIPVVTDVHSPEDAKMAADVCDSIQIPAFLCRQTDLVVAAGETGKMVSIKKGQFMAPWDMEQVVKKIESTGNKNILLTDRGTMFGYNNLVSDMRGIPIMQKLGYPVCFDASHSVQLPGGLGNSSGGQREFIPTLAKSAVAAGANCLFIETHPNPSEAKSDAASVFPISQLADLLTELVRVYEAVNVGKSSSVVLK